MPSENRLRTYKILKRNLFFKFIIFNEKKIIFYNFYLVMVYTLYLWFMLIVR